LVKQLLAALRLLAPGVAFRRAASLRLAAALPAAEVRDVLERTQALQAELKP
jgi:hypothetical protein